MQNLHSIEACVWIIVLFQERSMGSTRGNRTVLDTIDIIRTGNRTHTVRYENNDFLIFALQELRHNQELVFRIELVRPFIKDDNRTILKQNPNTGEYLFFPTGKFDIVTEYRFQSKFVGTDFTRESECFQILPNVPIIRGNIYPEHDIFSNRCAVTQGERYLRKK